MVHSFDAMRTALRVLTAITEKRDQIRMMWTRSTVLLVRNPEVSD